MKVIKFGGTALSTASRMKDAASIASRSGRSIIVLSAISGTTARLSEVCDYLSNGNADSAAGALSQLKDMYMDYIASLFGTERYRASAESYLESEFSFLLSMTRQLFTQTEQKLLLAQGELMSSQLFTMLLEETGNRPVQLCALEFIKTDGKGEPDQKYIRERLSSMIEASPDAGLFITQGAICRNIRDEVDNLRRGGSDYTAALAGAAVRSDEIQIWTDVDASSGTGPFLKRCSGGGSHLNFDEAAELGYFGAKMLHPTCIQPAKFADIPVRLMNMRDPSSPGTLIDNVMEPGTIKAVAAKDNIASISIRSSRMLLAHGFLRKVFEVFESYQTSIDMISTSEVGVSVSVDDTLHLNAIVHDLKKYGTVDVDLDMCIVCIVGDMDWKNVGFESRALEALKDIPVRMISYGGSDFNISFLVRGEDREKAMQSLRNALFENA